MRKLVFALLLAPCLLMFACRLPNGTTSNGTSQMKLVALGDSLAMGIQDAGLVKDSQYNDFPYLIAKQMGSSASFEQPYVDEPGIGVPPYKEPLNLQSGQIIQTLWASTPSAQDIFNDVLPKLSNKSYPQPYNNLAVNGAVLSDLENATTYSNSAAGDNYFFDIVLRNNPLLLTSGVPNFGGKTAVKEALMLDPDIILLWIGNNDVLGTVLNGAGTNNNGTAYTNPTTFTEEYTKLLTDLTTGSHAHIVMATIPGYLPYANALDGIYQPTSKPGGDSLVLFNPTNFEPIDFSAVLSSSSPVYVPLLLDEPTAEHLLLTGAIAYLDSGEGIPGSSDLTGFGYSSTEATNILNALSAAGLKVPAGASGTPLTGDLTITTTEQNDAESHIADYNQTLEALSAQFGVPLVDMTASWWGLNSADPFGGYSGLYALQAQDTTVFSLDGVHPDNLGHALCANEFIKVLNAKWNLKIPLLNVAAYAGQYAGRSILPQSLRAIKAVGDMYSRKPAALR